MYRSRAAMIGIIILFFVIAFTVLGKNRVETREFDMATLLRTSIEPVGRTMYVWGGGWNKKDTGAGKEAVSIGVSKRWERFASCQTSEYDYTKTRYQIHDGLDCSGYIGWLVYNVFHTVDGREGYVMRASDMAQEFCEKGFGKLVQDTIWKTGDICSMDDHVWMSLGQCSDGSVLLVHASPPGVRISGTYLEDGTKSEAVRLAEKVMKTYYEDWYRRYPECGVTSSYLKGKKFRWYTTSEKDPCGLQDKPAQDIVSFLYG